MPQTKSRIPSKQLHQKANDPSQRLQLIEVIRRGSLATVQELLSRGVNPNFQCSNSGKTCLEIASEGKFVNAANIVSALLAAGADGTSVRPMLLAARVKNFDTLATLLRHSHPSDTAFTTTKGMTLLHQLCIISCNTHKLPQLITCLNLALDIEDAPVNLPDALGMTPIMHAVERYYEDRVYAIIMHKKHPVNLDFVLPMTGNTTRQELLKRFSELADYLPPPLFETLDSTEAQYKLLAALQHRRLDIFEQLLRQVDESGRPVVDPNYWYDEPYCSTSLLLACRIRGSENFVKALLNAGADPKYEKCNMKSFLGYVICTCNYATLKALLDSGRVSAAEEGSNGTSVLQMAVMQRQISSDDSEDGLKCIKLILEEQKKTWDAGRRNPTLHIDYQDSNGNTALHYASMFGNKDAALLLLRNGASVLKRNCKNQKAFDVIPPDTLRNYLDELIDCNRFSPRNGFDSIIFNYDFLSSPDDVEKESEGSEIQILLNLTKPKLRQLILHPVIFSYLLLKWNRVKFLFAINFIYNSLFVITLNVYIISTNPKILNEDVGNVYSSISNETYKIYPDSIPPNEPDKVGGTYYTKCLSIALKCLLIKLIAEEIVKIKEHGVPHLKTFKFHINILLTTLTAIMLSLNGSWNEGVRHLSAIVTLLSWIMIILLAGMLPSLSVQLKMLEKVAKTFFKFMVWYSLILVAFALCFHCMFRNSSLDEFFINPGLSLLRTITMFAGEFSISSMAFSDVPITSHIIFIIFVLLVAVVLLNLLNGLAVHDTQAIREKAAELGAAHLMVLIANYERFLLFIKSSKFCKIIRLDRMSRDPRIWQSNQRRRVFVFPDEEGIVKFYMDPINTELYQKFRFPQELISNATIIINSRDDFSNTDVTRKLVHDTNEKVVDLVATCRILKKDLFEIRKSLVDNKHSIPRPHELVDGNIYST